MSVPTHLPPADAVAFILSSRIFPALTALEQHLGDARGGKTSNLWPELIDTPLRMRSWVSSVPS